MVIVRGILDESINESIDQISAVSQGLTGHGLDLKKHIENEMDFYLGVVMAVAQERWVYKAAKKGLSQQQIISVIPFVVVSLYTKIPKFKTEINRRLGV